jgi:hypothetical protein
MLRDTISLLPEPASTHKANDCEKRIERNKFFMYSLSRPEPEKPQKREEKIENKFEMENLLITVDGSSTAIHHKNAHFPSEKKSIS